MFHVPVLGPFMIRKSQFGRHLSQAGNAAHLEKYLSVKVLVSPGLSADSCYGGADGSTSELRFLDEWGVWPVS